MGLCNHMVTLSIVTMVTQSVVTTDGVTIVTTDGVTLVTTDGVTLVTVTRSVATMVTSYYGDNTLFPYRWPIRRYYSYVTLTSYYNKHNCYIVTSTRMNCFKVQQPYNCYLMLLPAVTMTSLNNSNTCSTS